MVALPGLARPNKRPDISVSFGRTLSENSLTPFRTTPCVQQMCENLPLVATECDGSKRPSEQTVGSSSPRADD